VNTKEKGETIEGGVSQITTADVWEPLTAGGVESGIYSPYEKKKKREPRMEKKNNSRGVGRKTPAI